jgi:hypothetical protein
MPLLWHLKLAVADPWSQCYAECHCAAAIAVIVHGQVACAVVLLRSQSEENTTPHSPTRRGVQPSEQAGTLVPCLSLDLRQASSRRQTRWQQGSAAVSEATDLRIITCEHKQPYILLGKAVQNRSTSM